MGHPSLRVQARFPFDGWVTILGSDGKTKIGDGRFENIGLGGAKIESESALDGKTVYYFRFQAPSGQVTAAGSVAWEAPPDSKKPKLRRYGIRFELAEQQGSLLRTLIDILRGNQAPGWQERLGDYWRPRGE